MDKEINEHVLKTGTLTIGIVCKDGIVLAADKRMTYGSQGGGVSYLAGKAKKIIEINERIIATMAGNASDAIKDLNFLKAELRLKELKTRVQVSIEEASNLLANMLFQNIRTPAMIPSIAHVLLTGYDNLGVHLFNISPDGHLQKIEDYEATGSGIMQAHPILDSEYKEGMSLEEGIKLVAKCIKASTGREPGVGNGVDIYTVKKGEIKQVLAKETVYELKDIKD